MSTGLPTPTQMWGEGAQPQSTQLYGSTPSPLRLHPHFHPPSQQLTALSQTQPIDHQHLPPTRFYEPTPSPTRSHRDANVLPTTQGMPEVPMWPSQLPSPSPFPPSVTPFHTAAHVATPPPPPPVAPLVEFVHNQNNNVVCRVGPRFGFQ